MPVRMSGIPLQLRNAIIAKSRMLAVSSSCFQQHVRIRTFQLDIMFPVIMRLGMPMPVRSASEYVVQI